MTKTIYIWLKFFIRHHINSFTCLIFTGIWTTIYKTELNLENKQEKSRSNSNEFKRLLSGGESGIWTRATITRTNTLAGCPLWPLEYLSIKLGAWCFTSSGLIISYDLFFLKYFYKKSLVFFVTFEFLVILHISWSIMLIKFFANFIMCKLHEICAICIYVYRLGHLLF